MPNFNSSVDNIVRSMMIRRVVKVREVIFVGLDGYRASVLDL